MDRALQVMRLGKSLETSNIGLASHRFPLSPFPSTVNCQINAMEQRVGRTNVQWMEWYCSVGICVFDNGLKLVGRCVSDFDLWRRMGG